MFSNAFEKAKHFTFPVAIAYRHIDKSVISGIGSVVIINSDGWLLSAAHIFNFLKSQKDDIKEAAEYEIKVQQINSDIGLKGFQKQQKIKALSYNSKWITNSAIVFGYNIAVNLLEFHPYWENDLVLIKISPETVSSITTFPTFKNPQNFRFGTSLCKLGFPFSKVDFTFNEASQKFNFNYTNPGYFPIDGIYTRDLSMGRTTDGSMDKLFLETSSPGLMGQSGGPIFDTGGNIFAIQSQNFTHQLGFVGKAIVNKKTIEEIQFLNVGIGGHGRIIVDLLRKHGINFQLVD